MTMKNKFSSKENLGRYLSLTITLWAGVTFSIIAFVYVLQSNMTELKHEFLYESTLQTNSLQNDLFAYQRGLELLRRFFESSENVTEEEFKHFAQPLFSKGNFSHILWLKKQSANSSYKATFCTSKDGYRHFSDFSPSMDLEHYPEIVLAIRESYKTKAPVLSKNIKFLSDTPHSMAFVYPVTKADTMTGLVIGIMDLDKVFHKNFAFENGHHKELFIYNEHNLMFKAEGGMFHFNGIGNLAISPEQLIAKSAFYYQKKIPILSDHWQVIFAPSNQYLASSAGLYPWLILFLGIAATAVLALFLFNLIGKNISVANAVKDATKELEHNRQHIQSILNSVLEGIITINSHGVIQTFNPAAEEMFGYTKEEVIGKNVKVLMAGENKEHHHLYIQNYLNTGEAKIIGIGREVQARHKDGDMFPMSLGITETTLDGEKIFVGIVRDITKEKKFQKRLEEARLNAEKANKAKSEFLATMSHEIRTPMNGIIGVAELLSYDDITAKQEKYVNTIRSSGELLLSLINDVLDFSKIEAGELELENIPVILNALAEEVMNLLNSKAHENNIELVVRIPQDVPLAILSDPVRLRQILINLLGNAIKFTKNGHVLLNVERLSKRNNKVVLKFEVKDTGVGIPENKISTIFEQFCQVDSSTTREFGGTGLGLTICKKLINMMGGDINVESVEGKGSNFWFQISFPIAKDYTQIHLSDTKKLKNKRILVIDDYQVNLEVLSGYLRHIGIKCDTEISTDRLFEKIETANARGKPYDIIVVDYYMPGLNGMDVSRKIFENKKLYGNPALVLLTSLDRKFDSNHLAESGFSACLMKPVYPHTLVNTLINAFEQHNLRSESDIALVQETPQNILVSTRKEGLPSFNAKVLVVEDSKANQSVIEAMLIQLGCSVILSNNGRHALEVLKEQSAKIDLILMDCQMPEMDGFEATKEIRKLSNGKKLPIVALTANALQGDREKCLNAGMDAYMSKPLTVSELIKTLSKYSPKSDAA